MANDNSNTGRGHLNDNLKAAAANVGGVAADLAGGATAFQAASNALKGAALDKLVGPTALLAGGLVGVLRTLKLIVDQSGILERGMKRIAGLQQIQGKFETLLKSAEKAQARLKDLYKFAATAPFSFDDIAQGNRTLEALAKGALSGAAGMKLVGDAAAATGQSFSDVATQVGKLYNALRSGRALDKVLFQLQFGGLVTDELASKLENAEQAGADFASKWSLVTQELSRTEGGMKNEMRTLGALELRLKNASDLMAEGFGRSYVESHARAMENTLKATQNLTPLVAKIGQDLAPILKALTNVKNSIVDATLATKGFADGLGVVWTLAKSAAVAIAAASAASLVRNAGGLVRGAATRSAAVNASKGTPDYTSGLAKSQGLAADAGRAFAEGALLTAAALKLQSLWVSLSTRAVTLHRTALAAATAANGTFTASAYAATLGTGVFKGALTALRTVMVAVFGATGQALLATFSNPLTAIAAAAGAIALAIHSWKSNVEAAHKELLDYLGTMAKVREEARRAANATQDVDQYRDNSAANAAEQKKVIEQMKALGPRPGPYEVPDGFGGSYMVEAPAAADWDMKRAEMNRTLRTLRGSQKAMDEKVPGLAPGKDERSRIVANVEHDLRNRDAIEQEAMNRASDMERKRLLERRIARRGAEMSLGAETEAGQLNPEKFKDSPTELMRLSQQIAAKEAAGEVVPQEWRQRAAELNHFAQTWRDMAGMIEGDRTALHDLTNGLNTNLRGVATGRARDAALARGDLRGAQGATDLEARGALRDQYRALGLSERQADSDFALRMKAEATQGQKIVADSSQSIGGGGGFGGSNPAIVAAQRALELHRQEVGLLAELVASARGGVN